MNNKLKVLLHCLGNMIILATGLLFAATFAGCGSDNGGDDGGGSSGGGGSSVTVCEQLAGTAHVGTAVSAFWPVGNTYGVNSFYLWDLDNASTPGNPEYYYKSTGNPVRASLPNENWQIPPTLWMAIRMNWDGLDPYHFMEEDPFYLGYLPYVNSYVSWQSKTNATNDGTCPEEDYLINGRQRCQGVNQLDPNSPTLVAGK
jgi:hypothetical protein